jgi:hypothetical protein
MRHARWWIGVGTAAALLGGSARAGTDDDATTTGGYDPAAQPAPAADSAQSAEVNPGAGADAPATAPATAPAKEGEPARTAADPGAGDIEIRSRPVGVPGTGRDDASELDAGNSGGRG